MEFNIDKCKVMHVGRTNTHSIYHMNNIELGTTSEEKDLSCVFVSDDLKVSKHCAYAYSKANRTLGMIKRTFKTRDSRLLLSLYKTMVLRIWSIALQPGLHTTKKTRNSLRRYNIALQNCLLI